MRNSVRLLAVFSAIVLGWSAWICAAAASLQDGGFEEAHHDDWHLNYGGEGGGTSGAGISTNIAGAHGGTNALLLAVETVPGALSYAWASASQQTVCSTGDRFTILAWLRCENETASTNAMTQCVIEYFADRECRELVTQHMRMTGDLPVVSLSRGGWTQMELSDTVPGGATTMRVSIVLTARAPTGGRQEIAVDDVGITVTRPAPVHEKK